MSLRLFRCLLNLKMERDFSILHLVLGIYATRDRENGSARLIRHRGPYAISHVRLCPPWDEVKFVNLFVHFMKNCCKFFVFRMFRFTKVFLKRMKSLFVFSFQEAKCVEMFDLTNKYDEVNGAWRIDQNSKPVCNIDNNEMETHTRQCANSLNSAFGFLLFCSSTNETVSYH